MGYPYLCPNYALAPGPVASDATASDVQIDPPRREALTDVMLINEDRGV